MAGDIGPSSKERQFSRIRDCWRQVKHNDGFFRGLWKGTFGSFWSSIAGSLFMIGGFFGYFHLSKFYGQNYSIPYAVCVGPPLLALQYFYWAVLPANLMVTAGNIKTHPEYNKLYYLGLRNSYKDLPKRVMFRGLPAAAGITSFYMIEQGI